MKNIDLHKDIKVILSDRFDGVSKKPYDSLNLGFHVKDNPLHVQKNREIFASFFDTPVDNLVFMNQVHSNSVLTIDKNGSYICDGLITNNKNLVLCVMVADCAPVVLYDSKNKVSAALHVGRKGAFSNIIKNAFQKMQTSFNSNAKDIYAYIGPHIKSCCYEIDGKVLKEAQKNFNFAIVKKDYKSFLDLEEIIFSQFEALNIVHVKREKTCTCCNTDYFSYRRDGVTGRFGVGVEIL